MKMRFFFNISLLVLALCAGVFTSCSAEQEIRTPGQQGDEATVTFSLQVPGASSAGTRSLTATEESSVTQMDVMVFQSGGGTYLYTRPSNAAPDNTSPTFKKFEITLPVGTFDLVFVANGRADIHRANFVAGATKQSVIAALEHSMAVNTKWTNNTIPMFGYRDGIAINANTDLTVTGGNDIKMHRMLSKIEVKLDPAAAGVANANFEITSVHLYNYNNAGTLLPEIDDATAWDGTSVLNKALKPHVPTSAVKTKGPLSYISADDPTGTHFTKSDVTNTIYTYEAAEGTTAGMLNNTCVVVGGSYKGSGVDTHFYRMDFVKTDKSYLSLLRNHKYIFTIKTITGEGFPNKEDAFTAGPVNIEASVLEWNDGGQGDVAFDGQYVMGVSPTAFSFYIDQTTGNKITILTDYPTVPTATIDAAAPWLTTNTAVTAKPALNEGNRKGYEYTFNCTKNGGIGTRSGYITIKAGRLELKVKVVQSILTNSFLSITEDAAGNNAIEALEFAAAAGATLASQSYSVHWSPQDEVLYPSLTSVAKPGTAVNYDAIQWTSYHTLSGSVSNATTLVYTTPINTDKSSHGKATFTITPKAISQTEITASGDPFYERQTMVSFRATGATGTMRKSILLQQYVYNMKASAEAFYLADGSTYTFNVKSNRPWKAYLVDDGIGLDGNPIVVSPAKSMTTPFASGGYNLPGGTNVPFKTANDLADPKIISGTAKVRIEWQGSDDPDEDWIVDNTTTLFCASGIIQPLSNSYIVKPGGLPILIPVKRANGALEGGTTQPSWSGTPIGASTAYTAELVWSDVTASAPNASLFGLDNVGGTTPVKMIQAAGNGTNGYILVMPGAKEGNAVVAAKVGANIVWSWHIWVTDPANFGAKVSGSMMDRNLGAMNATVRDPGTLGLMYQWGRKDPFVGSQGWTNSTRKTIYNKTGVYSPTSWTTGGATVAPSISNPAIDYSDWAGSNGDYSWNTQTTNLYTLYDPCPIGWRVPATTVHNVNGTYPLAQYYGFSNSTTTPKYIASTTWDATANQGGMAIPSGYKVTGYYPAAGTRSGSTTNNVGTNGYYWSATPNGTNSYNMDFISNGVVPSNNGSRNNGFSVRCVAE